MDTFAGSAAMLVAALEEGVVVQSYYWVDNDPWAMLTAMWTVLWALSEERFEGKINKATVARMFTYLDVRDVDSNVLAGIQPTVVSAGSPCQGFSEAQQDAARMGLAHPQSALFLQAVRVMRQSLEVNPTCVYLFENVMGFLRFPALVALLEDSLPGQTTAHCASDVAACYRKRVYRTNVRGVRWSEYDARRAADRPQFRWWQGCLSAANEEYSTRVVGKHQPGDHFDDAPRRTSRYNTFPVENLPAYNYHPVNYNVIGDPVRVTNTFMASGVSTYTMRLPTARDPEATGAGLVWCPDLRTLRAPRMLAVASAMGVPLDLAHEVLFQLTDHTMQDFEAVTGLRAPDESDYRKQVGNAFQIDVVRRWWRRRRETSHAVLAARAPDSLSAGGLGGGAHPPRRHDRPPPRPPPNGREDREGDAEQSGRGGEDSEDSDWDDIANHPEELALEALGEDLVSVTPGPADAGIVNTPLGVPLQRHVPSPSPLDPAAPPPPDVSRIVRDVREALYALREGQLHPEKASIGEGWCQAELNSHFVGLMETSLDGNHFQALRYQAHVEAWRAMFATLQEMGFQNTNATKPQARALKILSEGLRLQFRPISEMFTDGRPRAMAKHRKVRKLLQQTVGHQKAEEILASTSPTPVPIHFRNHKSCEEHREFIVKERDVFLKSGAMKKWWDLPERIHRGKPPKVVIPLAVAYHQLKKKYRLCCDARYLNLWIRYRSFKFESLNDLLTLVKAMQANGEDVLLCLSDMKSGYHHVPIHEDDWTYMAVIIEGEYYVFPAMTFGMSCAVEVYCSLEGEKHRALRQLGMLLVQYIDDRASPYPNRARALFCETWIVRLVTALGGFLSFGDLTFVDGKATFSKVQLWPLPEGEFLGFLICIARRMVLIPEKKIVLFLALCEELLGKGSTTAREKARFVGLLVSFMPAVVPCRLFLGRMYKALTGVTSWDALYETPEEEKAIIRFYSEHIRSWNGTRWVRRPVKLTLCGDASIDRGAAFEVVDRAQRTISDGGMLKSSITVYMPPHVVACGSTTREAHVCRKSLEIAIDALGAETLRDAAVVYIGDNMGMSQVMASWWAKDPQLCRELQKLYALCMRHGIEFLSEWQSRETPLMRLADALGKGMAVDNSQWALCPVETRRIIARYAKFTGGRTPTIDGMADPENAKAPAFISRELTQGCSGVDFFANLGLLAGRAPDGRKHLLWLNGDFGKMAQILQAIMEYRLDVILIFPLWPAPWRSLLEYLPVVAGPDRLPNRPRLFKPGSRVAKEDQLRVRYPVASVLVVWG